jgi:electron transfer flavoprotein alpha subunit
MPALVLAEHDNRHLKAATLNTVTAAAKAAGEVHVLVAGHDCASVAQQAAKIQGVTKVLVADAPHLADGLAENVAEQVLAVAKGYSHVFAPATSFGKNVLPRVAAKLDSAQVSDIIGVESADTFTRPIYAGNAIATVQSSDAIKVVTARPTNFDAAPAEGGNAVIESVAPVATPACRNSSNARSRRVIAPSCKARRSSFPAAAVWARRRTSSCSNSSQTSSAPRWVLRAPRWMRGYAPNDWQVGQTGKVVAPQLYIAVGISARSSTWPA